MIYTDLSPRQAAVLEFIKQIWREKGYAPSVREICDGVGLKSTSTVHTHLKTLEDLGYIRRNDFKQRAIEVVGADNSPNTQDDGYFAGNSDKELVGIPLLGTIAAGQPLFAEEQIEDIYPLPLDFLNSNSQLFMLRVRGDSMIEAGILSGDLIIVEKTSTVRNGEIAAVLLDDSATVKYFYKEPNYYRLEPANANMSSIIAFDLQILGRVIGLLRRF